LNKEKQIEKGKEQAIAKWEAEVRKSIASKKAASTAPPTLTKPQQALFNAQLEKERQIRGRVVGIVASMTRGLGFIRALASSGADEIQNEFGFMAGLVLQSILSPTGSALLGEASYKTYLVKWFILNWIIELILRPQELTNYIAERLGSLRQWIAIAILRSLNAVVVPEELRAEPLNRKSIRN
jgi:hypothetical protein